MEAHKQKNLPEVILSISTSFKQEPLGLGLFQTFN
jgi:hypothetical protein